MLEAAGHTLDVRNLLSTAWTADHLLRFLSPWPVADWFNRAAPRVKSGEVVPEQLDAQAALALLRAEPLLIRRPLMEAGGQTLVGFDPTLVDRLWGLTAEGARLPAARAEGCAAALRPEASPSGA